MNLESNYGFRGQGIANVNVDLISFLQPSYMSTVDVVDYHGALAIPGDDGYDGLDRDDGFEYQPPLTVDGVNPDASAYPTMTTMAEQGLSSIFRWAERNARAI